VGRRFFLWWWSSSTRPTRGLLSPTVALSGGAGTTRDEELVNAILVLLTTCATRPLVGARLIASPFHIAVPAGEETGSKEVGVVHTLPMFL
jgi:hypothetical protein